MVDDANNDKPTTGQPEAESHPRRRPAPAAGWEARALARVKAHIEQLSKEPDGLPEGWETDTVTRLEDYFENEED